MLAREELAESFGPGTHGSTFGGNPLVTAAALAAVQTIFDEGILEHTLKMGDYLTGQLKKLQKKFAFITEVRGIGLIIGAELSIPGSEIVRKALEKGLLINVAQDRVLRFVPPLIVEKQEIDEMIAILKTILSEVPSVP
jgi:acetylornithine/N-succinyldiaminopimelate aminotransferase